VISRKNAHWWVLALAGFVFLVPRIAAVITLVVLFIGYLISIQLHPHRSCRACGGTGRHSGYVYGFANRPCGSCGSAGRHRRWGAQFFHPNKQVRAEARSTAAGRRRGKPL
jgi:DnaJ-class molecular chaperone